MNTSKELSHHATRNPCRLCTPFGACMVFHGIAGCVPFIHGSQGCATYIRRYLIGHFREPVDIACSNFGEQTTVFGGKENLRLGLANVIDQYSPDMIGICTTCLAETIGDDVEMFLREIRADNGTSPWPVVVSASTASYCGTHTDGFKKAVCATVKSLASDSPPHEQINIFPGMLSPADIRYLKEILADFDMPTMVLPDYSDSFDGVVWGKYEKNIEHGTALAHIAAAPGAKASIEFAVTAESTNSAAGYLLKRFSTPFYSLPLPIGVENTDRFLNLLSKFSSKDIPDKHQGERGRLIDTYVDGHKYVFEKKAVIYGEQDMVVSLAGFAAEIGMTPVLCATGDQTVKMRDAILDRLPQLQGGVEIIEDTDFWEIAEHARTLQPDIILGNSNGYKLSRDLNIPLVRIGLPIHDRMGAARILHIGYRGTQQLYDRIVNALIGHQQELSEVAYTHI